MLQKILQCVKTESEYAHLGVPVPLTLHVLPLRLKIPCQTRPHERQRHHDEQRRHPRRRRQPRIFKVEAAGLEGAVQIFCLPALSIASQVLSPPTPVREVEHLPGGVFGGQDAEPNPVDFHRLVPNTHLTDGELAEARPYGHPVHLAGSLEADAGRDAVLIEEREPRLADELSVGEKTGHPTLAAHRKEAIQEGDAVGLGT